MMEFPSLVELTLNLSVLRLRNLSPVCIRYDTFQGFDVQRFTMLRILDVRIDDRDKMSNVMVCTYDFPKLMEPFESVYHSLVVVSAWLRTRESRDWVQVYEARRSLIQSIST
jgi:hypothetical protein